MPLKHITRYLREGSRLHAFRSGGGLRVVRMEKDKRGGKLIGYGEHPHIGEALKLANKTLAPLGRMPKKSVYLTGSQTSEDALDEWVLSGHTFDAWLEGEEIVVQLLNPYHSDHCPAPILEEALRKGSAEWHHRGGITKISGVSCRCNGGHKFGQKFDETHWSYSLDTTRETTQPWSYTVAKTGRGKDFDEALKNALEAPQLEVEQKKAA